MWKIKPQTALSFAVGLISGAVVGILLTGFPVNVRAWKKAAAVDFPIPSLSLFIFAALLFSLTLVGSLGLTRIKELRGLLRGKSNVNEMAREELGRQASALSSLAAGHHERAQASIAFLQKTDLELTASDDADSLKRVLVALRSENDRNLDYTSQLERDLKIAQQRATVPNQ
jgi:hypothetical protein